MLTTRTAAAVCVWATAGIVSAVLFLYGTPALEARFAPVLIDQRIEHDAEDRTPGRMCWTWKWTKARHAEPVVVAWSISLEGTAVQFPAVTQRQRDGQVLRHPQATTLGQGQNDLCVLIPIEIDSLPGLTIRGSINYRMPHGLWTIWQDLPVVRVPPVT